MGVCRLGVELEDLGAHNACNLKSARGEEGRAKLQPHETAPVPEHAGPHMACMEKPRCVWKMERGRTGSGKIMTNDYREENLRNRIPVGLRESVERLGRFYVYQGCS